MHPLKKVGRMVLLPAAVLGAVAVLLLFPVVHAVVVLANFTVHMLVLGLQLVTSRLPRVPVVTSKRPPVDEPFVSIQVPAHNEPPELLCETLLSLSRLRWKNFEVLVIDNNTADPALWRPVQKLCRELGPKFRFFHVENLAGFKAGALNFVRPLMDPRARFIFVVDADYLVQPNALRRALSYFTDENIGLVQFPQDYRNVGNGNLGIALDFKHFFSGYMTMANGLGCVPSTGTLSLINVEALKAINGFDTEVITEDADLGLRLSLKGYRTLFANETIGQGVMPYDLESLKKQRWRWSFGNAQILKLNWKRLLFGRELRWPQKLGFIAHLTVWFNFNLIPSLSLMLLAPVALFERIDPLQHYVLIISGFTLMTYFVMRFGTIFYSLRADDHRLREIWLAYLTHIGLGWVFSASWIKCLYDHRSPFVRTDKSIARLFPGVLRATLVESVLGIGLLGAFVVLALSDFIMGPTAAIVMCVGRFMVYWVWRQTCHTWLLSKKLLRAPEEVLPAEESVVLAVSPVSSRSES